MSEFRRRLMMVGGGEEPIPYQQIEYLEGDGTAYINTDYTANSISPIIEANVFKPSTVSANSYVFGSDGSGNTRFSVGFLTSNRIELRIGRYRNFAGYGSGWYKLKIDGVTGEGYINDSLKWTSTTLTFSENPITVFNRSAWTTGMLAGVRISTFKLWNASTLLIDFIPVRIETVGYMYDKVSGNLFGNAAESGAFVLGNDVNT